MPRYRVNIAPMGCVTLCMLGNFACFFVICGLFCKINFFKKKFGNTVRVLNCLDPDQA